MSDEDGNTMEGKCPKCKRFFKDGELLVNVFVARRVLGGQLKAFMMRETQYVHHTCPIR